MLEERKTAGLKQATSGASLLGGAQIPEPERSFRSLSAPQIPEPERGGYPNPPCHAQFPQTVKKKR